LQCFSPLTTDDVINAVRRPPDKFLAADPIPMSVLNQVIDVDVDVEDVEESIQVDENRESGGTG